MLGRRIRRLHYSILLLRYCIHLPGHCRHFISIPPSLLFFAYNINKFLYPNFRPAWLSAFLTNPLSLCFY
uniref:ORF69 n=1 Tax=Saccharolobus islandicus TaxID=43080 RepID=Q9C4Y2_SACIS|nr:ORF69 [Sulfolobus islandicus]